MQLNLYSPALHCSVIAATVQKFFSTDHCREQTLYTFSVFRNMVFGLCPYILKVLATIIYPDL